MDTVIDRIMARIGETPGSLDTPCWVTSYKANPNGYVQIYVDGRYPYVHRFMYEQQFGPIPVGLQLDHLCRVRGCCNPDHLEAVTQRENILRGVSTGALAVRLGKCKHGHSLDDAYARPGGRKCRTCTTNRARLQRKRAAA